MYSASVIARFFVRKGIENKQYVTQMKLQKMVYFAHGLHLAMHGKPLVNEEFEAWKFGPVVPDIYSTYKQWGSAMINQDNDDVLMWALNRTDSDVLADSVEEAINMTWEITKDVSGFRLSEWTHADGGPWKQAYKPYYNCPIPNESIQQYFKAIFNVGANQAVN